MMEGIWPEFCRKSRTKEHCTDAVADSAMRAFTRTIRVRAVRCIGFNAPASIFKQLGNGITFAEFATTVKLDMFVMDI